MVNEFDQIGEAEFMYGGNWLDYHLSDSTGDLGKIYDPTLNIFKEPMPVDIVGVACSSWTLNTNTGIYSSPVANPGVIKSNAAIANAAPDINSNNGI